MCWLFWLGRGVWENSYDMRFCRVKVSVGAHKLHELEILKMQNFALTCANLRATYIFPALPGAARCALAALMWLVERLACRVILCQGWFGHRLGGLAMVFFGRSSPNFSKSANSFRQSGFFVRQIRLGGAFDQYNFENEFAAGPKSWDEPRAAQVF